MPAAIDSQVKKQVINQWLSGDSRDRIAADKGIGAGTVSNIINEWKKGVEHSDYDSLRELTVYSKKEGYPYSNISPISTPRNPARHTLPGFSVSEIFQESKKDLPNILIAEDEIQKSVGLLLNERCLKKITVSDGEIRYDLFEPSLKAFFEACWDLFLELVATILKKWQFVCKPTTEELAWLRRIYGPNVDAYAREIHFERISFMRKDPKEIRLAEGVEKELLDKKVAVKDLILHRPLAAQKHRYLVERLLDLVYPRFLRPSISSMREIREAALAGTVWGYW